MLELLSPAGSFESFQAALSAGADAVYAGGMQFGARAYAANFSNEEILRAIELCHLYDRKLYLTVNTLCKDREMDALYNFLKPFYEYGLYGVIVQDIGVIRFIREHFPKLPIHASTQMTLTAAEGAAFLKSVGAERIVTSREISLDEIRRIHEQTDLEIESFVHGAMCYCYSGQCLFSSILGGRSGNRGRCAQPCRLPYEVWKAGEKRNKTEESYVLSMKDMCGLSLIPDMAEAGVVSFKIEGRMKKPAYTAGVTAIYRKYLDLYESKGREGFRIDKEDLRELQELYTRSGSESGYLKMRNGRKMITLKKPGYDSNTESTTICSLEKIPVKGICHVQKESPITLTLMSGGKKITVETEPAKEAQNRPVKEEDIRKQLMKMGATPFAMEELQIDLSDGCFVPVKALNELRRSAVSALEKEWIAPFLREDKNGNPAVFDMHQRVFPKKKTELLDLFVMVSSLSDIEDIMEEEIDGIYLESYGTAGMEASKLTDICNRVKREGKKIYLALPYIFRTDISRTLPPPCFDGVLARNYEELRWLKEGGYKGAIRIDFNLYTFNRQARMEFFDQTGCERDTVPLELNRFEWEERGSEESELMVYGRIPMMISAQCLNQTFGECRGRRNGVDFLQLKDRYHKEFPVLVNCVDCVNIIYNSVPLSLHAGMEKIRKTGAAGIRLVFTDERSDCRKKIIRAYRACINGQEIVDFPVKETTTGHWKRGVE